MCARYLDLYKLRKVLEERSDYLDVLTAWGLVILFLSVVFFLLKLGTEVSRGSVSSFCVLATLVLVAWRKFAKSALRSALEKGVIRGQRTVLIGTPSELSWIKPRYLLYRYGTEEIERVVLRPAQFGFKGRGAVDEVMDRIRAVGPDQIIIAMDWAETAELSMVPRLLPGVSAARAADPGSLDAGSPRIRRGGVFPSDRTATRAVEPVRACDQNACWTS